MKYTSLSIAALAAMAAVADVRPMAADGFAVTAGGGSSCDEWGLGTAAAVTACA